MPYSPVRFDQTSLVDLAALGLATLGGLLLGAARLLTRPRQGVHQ